MASKRKIFLFVGKAKDLTKKIKVMDLAEQERQRLYFKSLIRSIGEQWRPV